MRARTWRWHSLGRGADLRVEVWETGEKIAVISGNPPGLISLARALLTLAQDDVPDGRHFDFDTYGLVAGSIALRIELVVQPGFVM